MFTQLITTGKTNEKETQFFGRTERVRINLGARGDSFFISVKKFRLDYFLSMYILLRYV